MSRRLNKALFLVEAYRKVFDGKLPSKNAVIMCCSVAEHETRCGDSWNEAGNWGAIQRRTLTVEEKAVAKAGLTVPPSDAFEIQKGDSDPITGKYPIWFWAFPQGVVYPPSGLSGHAAGAWKLLQVLLVQRPSIGKSIDRIDPMTLATLMYNTHYYAGFHDPREPGGIEANIRDYGNNLTWRAAQFNESLRGWTPGGDLPPVGGDAIDLTTVEGIQEALNILGAEPPLSEDGVFGPRTKQAVMEFQRHHGLKIDGDVGPLTRGVIIRELAAKN